MMAHIVSAMRCLLRCIWVAALLGVGCAAPQLAGTDLGATDAPDFTLTDGITGRVVTLSAQRGQVTALTFLYTTCPDVCPLTASRFRAAQSELQADAGRVTFIAVSVDPDGDTPNAVREFSAAVVRSSRRSGPRTASACRRAARPSRTTTPSISSMAAGASACCFTRRISRRI